MNTFSQTSRLLAKIANDSIIFEEAIEKDQGWTSKTRSSLPPLDAGLTADISAVSQIDAVASILEVICRTTGMGFAAVARYREIGGSPAPFAMKLLLGLLPGGELDVKMTIGDEIRDSGRAVIIDHVAEDEHFRGHHTPRMYGLQSYISMPIVLPNGEMRHRPAAGEIKQARGLSGCSRISRSSSLFIWTLRNSAARQEAALVDAREAADLREQFVAILAHDLRNPLASIDAGINVLLRRGLDEKTLREIGGHIRNSARRMAGLIDDMLDFAKGSLGCGFSLDRNPDAPLHEHLEQVIGELRDVSENPIEAQLALWHPVNCDPKRIAQVASDLVANALRHGGPHTRTGDDQPTKFRAGSRKRRRSD